MAPSGGVDDGQAINGSQNMSGGHDSESPGNENLFPFGLTPPLNEMLVTVAGEDFKGIYIFNEDMFKNNVT